MLSIPILMVTLQSSIGLGWVLLGVLALLLLAIWSYRFTRPPLPHAGRLALALLRGLALVAVWLLVVQAAVHWAFERPVRTRIAVLIDRSESMSLRDGFGDRAQLLEAALKELQNGEYAGRVEWRWYSFAEALHPAAPNRVPPLNGPVTDLDRALRDLATLPDGLPDAVLLLSDGAVNRGGPPSAGARELAVPIFAVAIGDSLPPRDLVLTSVNNAQTGYRDEPLPVDVTLRATGLPGQRVELRLHDEKGTLLESQTVTVEGDWSEQTVQFEVAPDQAGINSWFVEVSPVAGEVDTTNNRRHATVRAAERRRAVLLLAGAPNPDAAVLARTLEGDPDTDLTVLIAGGRLEEPVRGDFREVADLTRFDAVLLTLHRSFGHDALALLGTIAESSLPMMIVTGDEPDSQALAVLDARLGGVRSQPGSVSAFAVPVGAHAILTQDGHWFDSPDSPPPLTLPPVGTRDGFTLASSGAQEGARAILSSTTSPRTLSWFAGGLWRWDLGRRSEDPSGTQFQALLNRILRYLITPEEQERVTLETERDLVTGGEEAQLFAMVQDESRRPLDTARITAQVTHDGNERTVEFRSIGGGRYRATVTPWGEGRYSVEAEVVMDGEVIHRETEFMVDPFHLELAEMRMRPDRLRSLSQATGGTFLLPDQMDSLPDLLPLEEGVEVIRGTWRPFGLWLTLLLVVALLAAEWIARTRTGMV